jgi:hypothetical protein
MQVSSESAQERRLCNEQAAERVAREQCDDLKADESMIGDERLRWERTTLQQSVSVGLGKWTECMNYLGRQTDIYKLEVLRLC